MNLPFPVDAVSELRIIHITDSHLLDSPEDRLYGLNTSHNLRRVLTQALTDVPDADFILFTGDISQTGSRSSYRIFQSIIAELELPVLCVPGNHDNPELLQNVVFSSPVESSVFLKQEHFSIVLMNSWVDQGHHGEFDANCMDQLQQFLRNSGSHFHIFAIHHPPVTVNSRWLDELGLKNRDQLLSLILDSGTPSLLLSGHIHQPLDLKMDQLRLLATPSTCHQFTSQTDQIQFLDHSLASFRYIKISLPDQIETSVHFIDCTVQD